MDSTGRFATAFETVLRDRAEEGLSAEAIDRMQDIGLPVDSRSSMPPANMGGAITAPEVSTEAFDDQADLEAAQAEPATVGGSASCRSRTTRSPPSRRGEDEGPPIDLFVPTGLAPRNASELRGLVSDAVVRASTANPRTTSG